MEELISIQEMRKHSVAPLEFDGSTLVMASLENTFPLRKTLEVLSGRRVVLRVEKQETIERLLNDLTNYDEIAMASSQSDGSNESVATSTLLDSINEKVSEDPVVKLLVNVLDAAIDKKASDIHIELLEGHGLIKLRVDGVLVNFLDALSLERCRKLISRVKVLAGLDIAEKRAPQDGRFRHRLYQKHIDCRVSIIPAKYGENTVLRLLGVQFENHGKFQQDLESLGVAGSQLNVLKSAVSRPHGIVLLSGPTGSGKTTTLYASLNQINRLNRKVITIEDPIEYELDHVMQIAVNSAKGVTFATGLRSILRHDPDIIMVGEIRDEETAKVAVQSALTGHLVLATIHANSAVDVFTRFTHMGVDKVDLISALNCIVNQRLIRNKCPKCSGESEGQNECTHCFGTGYSGRSVIAESLLVSDDFRKNALSLEKIEDVLERIVTSTDTSLRKEALHLHSQGLTDFKEVNRVTYS